MNLHTSSQPTVVPKPMVVNRLNEIEHAAGLLVVLSPEIRQFCDPTSLRFSWLYGKSLLERHALKPIDDSMYLEDSMRFSYSLLHVPTILPGIFE
jgi:hypothetical protein